MSPLTTHQAERLQGPEDHCAAVARVVPPQFRIVAYLHDAVEDGVIDLGDSVYATSLQPWELEALDLLTKRPTDTYVEYLKRIVAGYRTRGTAGRCALEVKLADLHHNLYGRPKPPNSTLARRYRRAIQRLKEAQHG